MAMRFQLSRRKGYRKPEGGVVCTRTSRWGNPYRIFPANGQWRVLAHVFDLGCYQTESDAREVALKAFRVALTGGAGLVRYTAEDVRRELAGKDLGCFCPLDKPCHADVLLEIANA